MIKKKLTAQVASQTGLTIALASQAVDAVFKVLKENLEKGEITIIQGFGNFGFKQCKARNGVNPSTGQRIIIPARKVVKFIPSKKIEIKQFLNDR